MNPSIRPGVSLYSFTQAWYERPGYGFADMFEFLKRIGVSQYEIVGAQSFDQYPVPRPETVRELLSLNERYGMTTFSYGGGVDVGKVTGRDMTGEEIFRETLNDLRAARMLGARYLRASGLPLEFLPRLAEMAERYDIRCGFEIHAPYKPSDPRFQAMSDAFDRIGSPYLGFVPDFGIFIERPSPTLKEYYIRRGAHAEVIEYTIANRHVGKNEETVWQEVQTLGFRSDADHIVVSELFGHQTFGPADFAGFKLVLPKSLYFHGKFYHIDENLVESSIDYDRLLRMVVESGFQGTLMTEYEGHAFYLEDAEEQVARHIAMQKRILSGL
jgi:sugar phosphate isomerase/epimerase